VNVFRRVGEALRRARARGLARPGEYRLIEVATGRLLGTSTDRERAFARLRDAQAQGLAWDALDLLDPNGHSLMIREHERSVDHAMGVDVSYLHSLAEAQAESAWVILDGDWGGQVYLTAPAVIVGIDEAGLSRLIHEIDLEAWGGQEEGSLSITYRRGAVGDGVWGGMGGGALLAGLWIHPELDQLGWFDGIEAMLLGRIDHLPTPQTVLTSAQRDVLGRALDAEDERLRTYVAPPYSEPVDLDAAIVGLIGAPMPGSQWYHGTILRALKNARLDTAAATIVRWREDAQRH
jgi:hypothetical protein